MLEINKIHNYNCLEGLKLLDDNSVDCCVTSPPYWGLRDYGTATWIGGDENCNHFRDNHVSSSCTTGHSSSQKEGHGIGDSIYKDICKKCGAIRQDEQIGLEKTPEDYVKTMVTLFGEVKRVLKPEGTLWLNLGDSYVGGKGQSGSRGSEYQEERSNNGESLNKGYQTLGGRKDTRPTDDRRMMKLSKLKPKDLVGIPWMTAFALRGDGWYLRQDIIWHKPNPMPESVTDRCTKSHEYIFLMSKSQKYYFDYEAIQEEATGYDGRNDTVMKGSEKYADGEYLQMGNANSLSTKGRERWKYKNLQEKGQQPHSFHESRADGIPDELSAIRNKRDVWKVATKPYREAHFATYPEELIVDCIKAGCPKGGVILDPFMGSGTTAVVARKLERNFIGFELNPKYIKIADKRLYEELGMYL